ncbi:MAG: AAA family ATPase, partial [Clostridia bacterium]|nr:AAA family ATPase [Clostridia bacterium]
MRRAVMDQLLAWKAREDRKPLLLTGVRQCGKTYILEEFGESSFDSYVHLNFDKQEGLASIFEYDFDVQRIVRELGSMVVGAPIVPGKTLLVFDEIQACPRAIESLKYFCEDMRELHIIAAGSLLG